MTGFAPVASPLSTAELGFLNAPSSSTAQMFGDTVGAYLNSADLPGAPVGQKMMITPQFIFTPGTEPVPFALSGTSLSGALDLQVPTAVGSDTYVLADYLFIGPNGVRLSYGVKIFANDSPDPVVGAGYASDSNTYQLNTPLGSDQRFITPGSDSALSTENTWVGWQHFDWSISRAQFVAGLTFLMTAYPGVLQTADPTQYSLSEVHLNAEFHFQPDPASLGWSMRNWSVWTTP
jgi:hypothetical protein